ncbi:MAG: hypothetical protein LBN96_03980 [Desulfovibrio sp.]|jgi:hypothetical protein|nr:hypothetical protein [Desulfovibrio sp.]
MKKLIITIALVLLMPVSPRGETSAEKWQATPKREQEIFLRGFLTGVCKGGGQALSSAEPDDTSWVPDGCVG